jgi:Asp-tRNA(Asn)/Glu-tRNA(Gln) amidotransferase C subunit
MLTYHDLWKPYSARMSFEQALAWLEKEAQARAINPALALQAVHSVLRDCSLGAGYPLDGCGCGCDLTNPHSAVIHEMHRRMVGYGQRMADAAAQELERIGNEDVLRHIEALNQRDYEDYRAEIEAAEVEARRREDERRRQEQEEFEHSIVMLSPGRRVTDKVRRIWAVIREGK